MFTLILTDFLFGKGTNSLGRADMELPKVIAVIIPLCQDSGMSRHWWKEIGEEKVFLCEHYNAEAVMNVQLKTAFDRYKLE